jgi:hypothetical protein
MSKKGGGAGLCRLAGGRIGSFFGVRYTHNVNSWVLYEVQIPFLAMQSLIQEFESS